MYDKKFVEPVLFRPSGHKCGNEIIKNKILVQTPKNVIFSFCRRTARQRLRYVAVRQSVTPLTQDS